jgi:hypothetical protein
MAAALSMRSLMERLKADDEILNQEFEKSQGDSNKMKAGFEKRIQLFSRHLNKEGLTAIDRLTLSNKNGPCHTYHY